MIAPLGATEHPEYLLAQLGELYNRMSGLAGRFARAGALGRASGDRGVRAASAPWGPEGLFYCRGLIFRVHVIVFLSLLVVQCIDE